MSFSNDLIMEVAVHAYNLDSRCGAGQSLEELVEHNYPLELLQKEKIKDLAVKYIQSRSLGELARQVVAKIEKMEMKVEKDKEMQLLSRKRSADSMSPGSSSSGASPPSTSDFVIASKRTMPAKFIAKPRPAVPLSCTKAIATTASPKQVSPPLDKKTEEERRLQKFFEKKRLEKEKAEAAKKEVSNVKMMLEAARQKNKEAAQKAKNTGKWEEPKVEAPKAKKGRFQWTK